MLHTLIVQELQQPIYFTTRAGEQCAKRIAIFREVGGEKADTYVVTILGDLTKKNMMVGDLVLINLRFEARKFEDRTYQEIVARDLSVISTKPY